MANTKIIRHKATNISKKILQSSDLELRELFINLADGDLFFKKNDNTIIRLLSIQDLSYIATLGESGKVNPDQLPVINWSTLADKPTTLLGYGIVNAEVTGGLRVYGDLRVDGTTTTIYSNTLTTNDVIINLGGEASNDINDGKDRGISFRYHNKIGYFGFDNSTNKFIFVPEATISSDLVSGIKGTIDANIEWNDILNKPAPILSNSEIALVQGITVSASEINYLSGVASNVQTQLSNKQPLNANLSSIVSLIGSAGLLRKIDENNWTLDNNNYLTQNQTITLSGAVSGTGTTNITITLNELSWTKIALDKPTTLLGYGIIDATPSSHLLDDSLHLTSSQNTLLDGITVNYSEINYLSGATANIQNQINNKVSLDSTGNVSISPTWNNSGTTFTGLKVNVTDTASNVSSNLLDLQVGGTSKFKVDKNGALYIYAEGTAANETAIYTGSNAGTLTHRVYSSRGTISSPSASISGDILIGYASFPRLSTNFSTGPSARMIFVYRGDSTLTRATDIEFQTGVGGANIWPRFGIVNTGGIWIQNSDLTSSLTDRTFIHSDVANTLAQRNSTNAQTYRIYNTYTDASNYERASLGWSTNAFNINSEAAGTGSVRAINFNLGTVVADTPLTINQTWNNAAVTFTGLKVNVTDTASNASSNLIDLQVGGVSRLKLNKGPNGGYTTISLYNGNGNIATIAAGTFGECRLNGGFSAGATGTTLSSTAAFGWQNNTDPSITDRTNTYYFDTKLYRDDIGIIAQRNYANAQTYRIYNTYTDASNYERASLGWSTNTFNIKTESAGTGTKREIVFNNTTVKFGDTNNYAKFDETGNLTFNGNARITPSSVALAIALG